MIESVLWARDRYLEPNGLMLPSHSRLYFAPTQLMEKYEEKINFWDSIFGISMKSLKAQAQETFFSKPMYQETIEPSALMVDSPALILNCDMHTFPISGLEFQRSPFSFVFPKRCVVTSFTCWFDCDFHASSNDAALLTKNLDREVKKLKVQVKKKWENRKQQMEWNRREKTAKNSRKEFNDPDQTTSWSDFENDEEEEENEQFQAPEPPVLTLSTSPSAPSTHWKQITFMLADPILIDANQLMDGYVRIKRNSIYRRHFEIEIHLITEDHGIFTSEQEWRNTDIATASSGTSADLKSPNTYNFRYQTFQHEGKNFIRRALRYDLWR